VSEAPSPAPLVLVVEDERRIAEIIRLNLERAGYAARVAATGPEAVAAAREAQPALVILDVMLPQMDGFAVCQALRSTSDVPVLMLTAKGAEEDKLRGFELGADDYLTKPFSMAELLARVRALLRRRPAPPAPPGRLRAGDLELDPQARTVRKGGAEVALTAREFALLHYLMSRPGVLVTREELLAEVWGYEYFGDSARTVDVAVWRLRNKIEDNPRDPRYILSRRGAGYLFRAEGTGEGAGGHGATP
jgi:two-component system response regulator VicR